MPAVSTTLGVLFPPLSGIGAQRADFVDDGFPVNEIDMVQNASATAMAPVTVTISNFGTTATMEITYNYTPAAAGVPAPAPAALLLLASGALLWARRDTRRPGKAAVDR